MSHANQDIDGKVIHTWKRLLRNFWDTTRAVIVRPFSLCNSPMAYGLGKVYARPSRESERAEDIALHSSNREPA